MEENGRSVTRPCRFNHPVKRLRKPLRMRLGRSQNYCGRLGKQRSLFFLPECQFGRAERSRVLIMRGARDYFLLQNLQTVSASSQPPSQWVPGSLRGQRRPEREVNHSLPSSAQVKNEWSCTSTLAICLHGLGRESVTILPFLPFACRESKRDSSVAHPWHWKFCRI
jgi:hypothetical protein